MQTFLPYSIYNLCVRCLDYRRLGKQRVECIQILKTNLGLTTSKAWKNHPAVLMWKNNLYNLCEYSIIICKEWIKRGYKDNCLKQILNLKTMVNEDKNSKPFWLGNLDFHLSHQSNLLRKKPEYYGKYFPGIPNNLPYIWPVRKELNV